MTWFDSFDAMQAADLDSTFMGGEFSSEAVVLRPAVGGVYAITCPVNFKGGKIEPNTLHVTNQRTIQALVPKVLEPGRTYKPRRGDVLEWDGEYWDFMMAKGNEAGAVMVVFQAVEVTEARKPTQL